MLWAEAANKGPCQHQGRRVTVPCSSTTPDVGERLDLEKRLRVAEEIRVTCRRVPNQESHAAPLRRERVAFESELLEAMNEYGIEP